MWKLPIILTLLLAIAWGYTSWHWYICNMKWLCDTTEERVTQIDESNTSVIRYNDVISENASESESDTIVFPRETDSSDAPKLSSDDVLSETPQKKEEPTEVVTEKEEKKETPTQTWSTLTGTTMENTENTEVSTSQNLSLCENPLVWPIGLGASNSKEEVERLEAFLAARGEDVTLNGIYEKNEFEAVKRFQLEHRADILDPWDITEPTGYVYKTTVKKINEIACK